MRFVNEAVKAMGRAALVAALLVPAAAVAEETQPAQAPVERSWKAEGRVWLEGDSTLHKYSAEARNLSTRVRVAGDAAEVTEAALRAGAMKALELVVPVARLTSGDSKLDKNMREALKGKANPNIVFKLKGYEVKGAEGAELVVRLQGTLTIAGVQKPMELDMKAKPNGGAMLLTGSKALKMTDFGIEPPVMMLGALKTSNDVVVKFEMKLGADPEKRA